MLGNFFHSDGTNSLQYLFSSNISSHDGLFVWYANKNNCLSILNKSSNKEGSKCILGPWTIKDLILVTEYLFLSENGVFIAKCKIGSKKNMLHTYISFQKPLFYHFQSPLVYKDKQNYLHHFLFVKILAYEGNWKKKTCHFSKYG